MNSNLHDILEEVYAVITDRKNNPVSGAYSSYLFERGENQIYKKLVSQNVALILAAKENDKELIKEKLGDVVYHLLVLMVEEGISLNDLSELMADRRSLSER